ncbi:MAG: Lactam utilization protein LamB [Deltaproteobacteria bacterium]|nr:Lactam utilization protein LamB [Deltaproteobacteria bacterium]
MVIIKEIMMLNRIDINSDMGESFGAYKLGRDAEVMDYISSANIACGWHAGDPMVMEQTVRMAKERGVGAGAHPGYPDLMGFGRRRMDLSMSEIENYILYQMGALYAFANAHGLPLQHVKAHGALGNLAFVDLEVSKAIARAALRFSKEMIFVTLTGTVMVQAAKEVGVRYAEEVYADRVYNPDGTLQSRKIAGSVIHDPEKAARQALTILKEGHVIAHDGTKVQVKPETLCVHGDTPTAISILRKIREELTKASITVKPMGQ